MGVGAAESAEPSGTRGCESIFTRRITMFAAQLLTPPPGTERLVSFLFAQRKGSSKGQVTIQGQVTTQSQEASAGVALPDPTGLLCLL